MKSILTLPIVSALAFFGAAISHAQAHDGWEAGERCRPEDRAYSDRGYREHVYNDRVIADELTRRAHGEFERAECADDRWYHTGDPRDYARSLQAHVYAGEAWGEAHHAQKHADSYNYYRR